MILSHKSADCQERGLWCNHLRGQTRTNSKLYCFNNLGYWLNGCSKIHSVTSLFPDVGKIRVTIIPFHFSRTFYMTFFMLVWFRMFRITRLGSPVPTQCPKALETKLNHLSGTNIPSSWWILDISNNISIGSIFQHYFVLIEHGRQR